MHLQVDVQDRVDDVPPVLRAQLGQPLVHRRDEAVEVPGGKRLHHRALVREELVQRTDGDSRSFGDQGRRQRVVTELVDQRRARVEHLLDPFRAALLDRLTA